MSRRRRVTTGAAESQKAKIDSSPADFVVVEQMSDSSFVAGLGAMCALVDEATATASGGSSGGGDRAPDGEWLGVDASDTEYRAAPRRIPPGFADENWLRLFCRYDGSAHADPLLRRLPLATAREVRGAKKQGWSEGQRGVTGVLELLLPGRMRSYFRSLRRAGHAPGEDSNGRRRCSSPPVPRHQGMRSLNDRATIQLALHRPRRLAYKAAAIFAELAAESERAAAAARATVLSAPPYDASCHQPA
eukprot:CAMPEP_0170138046 /NCGR_PEP_ID=MMETSP0033_2-20121228/4633_1 /TAXON_ID=195969 /ORGANISM="Dolichomastix tenuilepis, Strain CCMP3274" /LENGTH=246 /DNA_ID=CAMNT_0010374005 /DNA_START=58 /DNA_END=794 /DNA_ORIENTATION=+